MRFYAQCFSTVFLVGISYGILGAPDPTAPPYEFEGTQSSAQISSTTPSAPTPPPGMHEYQEVMKLIDEERYEEGIPELQILLQNDPKNPDLYHALGRSYEALGNVKDAIHFYSKALVIEPFHRKANLYLGLLYLKIHKPEEADKRLIALEKACEKTCIEYFELQEKIQAYVEENKN